MKMKTEILVVRDYDLFSSILVEQGFSVINFPTIKTGKLADYAELDKVVAEIENFDGIFITSPNAAEPFLERFGKYHGKIYVLGNRTKKLFKAADIEIVFYEDAKNAAELINSIPKNELAGKKFLYLCGNRSLRIIPEMLENLAEVQELIVYKTSATKADAKESDRVKKKLEEGKIAAVCFFSLSGAESFLEQFDASVLYQISIAAIGKTTAEFFERQNLKVGFVSLKPTAEDFAVGLINYLNNKLPAEYAEKRGINLK